jgi:hypothetical protein
MVPIARPHQPIQSFLPNHTQPPFPKKTLFHHLASQQASKNFNSIFHSLGLINKRG